MTVSNKIAAAILACEASRQQLEMVKSGPAKTPATRDIAVQMFAPQASALGDDCCARAQKRNDGH